MSELSEYESGKRGIFIEPWKGDYLNERSDFLTKLLRRNHEASSFPVSSGPIMAAFCFRT